MAHRAHPPQTMLWALALTGLQGLGCAPLHHAFVLVCLGLRAELGKECLNKYTVRLLKSNIIELKIRLSGIKLEVSLRQEINIIFRIGGRESDS